MGSGFGGGIGGGAEHGAAATGDKPPRWRAVGGFKSVEELFLCSAATAAAVAAADKSPTPETPAQAAAKNRADDGACRPHCEVEEASAAGSAASICGCRRWLYCEV